MMSTKTGPTPSTEEVDPEFAKQWSDADLGQILAAIQILFGLALRLLSHLHKVNLTVSADSGCSAISMVLQTEQTRAPSRLGRDNKSDHPTPGFSRRGERGGIAPPPAFLPTGSHCMPVTTSLPDL
jgi:hypothetical protein